MAPRSAVCPARCSPKNWRDPSPRQTRGVGWEPGGCEDTRCCCCHCHCLSTVRLSWGFASRRTQFTLSCRHALLPSELCPLLKQPALRMRLAKCTPEAMSYERCVHYSHLAHTAASEPQITRVRILLPMAAHGLRLTSCTLRKCVFVQLPHHLSVLFKWVTTFAKAVQFHMDRWSVQDELIEFEGRKRDMLLLK